MADRNYDVRENPDASRFELDLDGSLGVLRYRRSGDELVLTHTEVPEALEGKGAGSALVRYALEHARQQGLQVVPQCPFVRAYVERHPEYEDLIAG